MRAVSFILLNVLASCLVCFVLAKPANKGEDFFFAHVSRTNEKGIYTFCVPTGIPSNDFSLTAHVSFEAPADASSNPPSYYSLEWPFNEKQEIFTVPNEDVVLRNMEGENFYGFEPEILKEKGIFFGYIHSSKGDEPSQITAKFLQAEKTPFKTVEGADDVCKELIAADYKGSFVGDKKNPYFWLISKSWFKYLGIGGLCLFLVCLCVLAAKRCNQKANKVDKYYTKLERQNEQELEDVYTPEEAAAFAAMEAAEKAEKAAKQQNQQNQQFQPQFVWVPQQQQGNGNVYPYPYGYYIQPTSTN